MYIVMDLDATLLKDDRTISDFSLNILNELKDNGHIIVINTARSLEATLEVIDVLKPHYSILNGGTLIVEGTKKIYDKIVPNKVLVKILNEIIFAKTEEFSIQCDEGLFCNLEEYTLRNKKAIYFDYNNMFEYDASKILLKSDDGILPNMLSEKYNLKVTHYVNGPWYRLSYCDKHDGNLALYDLLKDNDPKSICFGDDIGDIEMLQGATVGVCLLNSVESVLNVIDIKTKYSNDEDGVAKYLKEYFNL